MGGSSSNTTIPRRLRMVKDDEDHWWRRCWPPAVGLPTRGSVAFISEGLGGRRIMKGRKVRRRKKKLNTDKGEGRRRGGR